MDTATGYIMFVGGWPLVPPYRASPMSTAEDCPETRGSLVRGERKWFETSNCVIDVETSSPSQVYMLGRVCATGRSVLASMPSCICNRGRQCDSDPRGAGVRLSLPRTVSLARPWQDSTFDEMSYGWVVGGIGVCCVCPTLGSGFRVMDLS